MSFEITAVDLPQFVCFTVEIYPSASDTSVADPETSERGGPRNMKYKPLHAAAILFWPIFTGQGGAMAPLAPPLDPLLYLQLNLGVELYMISVIMHLRITLLCSTVELMESTKGRHIRIVVIILNEFNC